jgi:Protein of unknown function (DUF2490)
MIRGLLCLVVLILSFLQASAQQPTQLWLDYQVDHPFANQYLFEVTGSYQTIYANDSKWRNFSVQPTFEYQYFNQFDFIATMPMMYSFQKDTTNSFEFDPSLGVRFHISQNKRIDSRLILKVEQRIFHQVEADHWQTSSRTRLKAEAWIAINGPNLYADKLWYGIVDYEEFIVMDQQVSERFANRRRGRIGLGYRLDYKNRFEFIYTRQSSRDEVDGGFIQDSNIIQLRYKLFLNPSKPSGAKVP